MMSSTLVVMWFYIVRGRRFVHGKQHFPEKFVWVVTLRYLFSPLAYSVALALGAVNYWVSIAVTMSVPTLSLIASVKFDIFKIVVDIIFWFRNYLSQKVEANQQQMNHDHLSLQNPSVQRDNHSGAPDHSNFHFFDENDKVCYPYLY